jgi:hypothetical protein
MTKFELPDGIDLENVRVRLTTEPPTEGDHRWADTPTATFKSHWTAATGGERVTHVTSGSTIWAAYDTTCYPGDWDTATTHDWHDGKCLNCDMFLLGDTPDTAPLSEPSDMP